MERRFDLGRIIISAVALLLVALFLLMIFNDSKLQNFLHPDIRQESVLIGNIVEGVFQIFLLVGILFAGAHVLTI